MKILSKYFGKTESVAEVEKRLTFKEMLNYRTNWIDLLGNF